MTGGANSTGSLLLFQTTTHVLWAEEVAQEEGVPVEVVPAPKDAKNVCGLALRTQPDRLEELMELLGAEGIPFLRRP